LNYPLADAFMMRDDGQIGARYPCKEPFAGLIAFNPLEPLDP
jgi:hypothetical protein